MDPYHKIKTAWHRDPETKHRTLIEGAWATEEFAHLADTQWVFTEKVDGTNIRIRIGGGDWQVGGRTDKAQIPAFLLDRLKDIAEPLVGGDLANTTLYGEGYGARIQKCGGNYLPDRVDFILFDVRCGDLWLERESVHGIADKAGIHTVPEVGRGTLWDAIDMAETGFNSTWGGFGAEGLIMRPAVELRDRRGARVIAKIKTRDFLSPSHQESQA